MGFCVERESWQPLKFVIKALVLSDTCASYTGFEKETELAHV